MKKKVFVTGSSAGIGLTTALMLREAGHEVIAHARNETSAAELRASLDVPVVVGDLELLSETFGIADAVSSFGPLDAVIHNAGIYERGRRVETADGMERTFQVNVLAPYVLTASIPRPARLVYLSSGMSSGGEIALDDLQREKRPWSSTGAYQDSKLCLIALALGFAERYPEVAVTAVCPGWVRSNMGGRGAPTDPRTGSATQVWLATSDEPEALRSGRYMRHMHEIAIPRAVMDETIQDGLRDACAHYSGVEAP